MHSQGRHHGPTWVVGAIALAAGILMFLAGLLLSPALASAAAYKPSKGKVYAGVSDTGNLFGYQRFSNAIGKHLPVMQTFHSWGTKPGGPAYHRWLDLKVRPMYHISTREGGGPEIITPGAIAAGSGDDYLLDVNRTFGANHVVGYIRPFGEMNGAHNPYCAYNMNGSRRDANHSIAAFKRAWIRMHIIIKGGGTPASINLTLKGKGLPPLKSKDPLPDFLPAAPVGFVWSPQLKSLPNKKGNAASKYFPGKRYVDWVGTDIFSNSANFALLNKFYKRWKKKGPFAIPEWSVALGDNSKFVKSLLGWVKAHKTVRMIVYYQGFSDADPYSPYQFPRALSATRKGLQKGRYIPYAPEF
jgi:hypothetical protein